MTRSTVIHDTGVIEHGVNKTAGNVTDAAILSCGEVVEMFTDGGYAIVAGRAVIHDAGMIKHCGGKRRGAMAVRAIPGRGHMVSWFAQGD